MTTPETKATSDDGGEKSRFGWIYPLVVGLVAFATFHRSLFNELVNIDDYENLIQNTQFRGLGWEQLRWMFTSFHLGPYQPLSWMTLGADWVVWGGRPVGYHLTNLLLHSAAAVMFYFLSLRLLRLARPETDGVAVRVGAAAAALLFAIHPLRVESVVWATERRDVLSGLFYFATVIAYLRYVEATGSARVRCYALTIGLFAMCLLSKAMGMTLPLALLILDVYPLRRVREAGVSRVLIEKLPMLALAAGVAIAAIIGQRQVGAFQSLERIGFVDRVQIAAYASCFYVVKTLAPFGLAPMYEIPRPLNQLQPYLVASVGVVLVTCLLAVLLRRRWPGFLAAWAFFLITLAPVSGLAHAGRQIAADRYTYLPMAGFAVLAGGGIAFGFSRSGRPRRRLPLGIGVCAAVLGLAFLSVRQSLIWHDSIRLWNRVLEIDPQSGTAHMNIAVQLHMGGANESALPHAMRAAMLRPDSSDCQFVCGRVLRGLGRDDEAFEHFRVAALAENSSPEAQAEYGIALARRGDLDAAAPFLERATTAMPEHAQAQMTLGLIQAGRGNGLAMRKCFEQASIGDGLTVESVRAMMIATTRVLGRPAAAEIVRRALETASKTSDKALETGCRELLAE